MAARFALISGHFQGGNFTLGYDIHHHEYVNQQSHSSYERIHDNLDALLSHNIQPPTITIHTTVTTTGLLKPALEATLARSLVGSKHCINTRTDTVEGSVSALANNGHSATFANTSPSPSHTTSAIGNPHCPYPYPGEICREAKTTPKAETSRRKPSTTPHRKLAESSSEQCYYSEYKCWFSTNRTQEVVLRTFALLPRTRS